MSPSPSIGGLCRGDGLGCQRVARVQVLLLSTGPVAQNSNLGGAEHLLASAEETFFAHILKTPERCTS
eukprot:NODE_13386_length_362_cov_1.274760_g12232_i0.p2 GENE.NODE_13386_length_362_cov_1.274760_g12232_i0~~NODE_13386_length_362_cov_1.274760_g12232_i0.p2  ORF type:complete len:68 (+),score=5.66 NODE_13386_length_362_cov_1.274760_g12232_i0:46-249(+)